MMNLEYVFDDIECARVIWMQDSNADTADLAKVADLAIGTNVPLVSTDVSKTAKIWPWLEKSNVQIFNRFDFAVTGDAVDAVSDLAKNVSSAFRNGAYGAQIFVSRKNIQDFIDVISPIRDDLFFNHGFVLAFDINEMRGTDWSVLFTEIQKIHPDAILVTAKGDTFDAKSDFVGLVYDMLMHWNLHADLHIFFGKNMFRVCQVIRMVKQIKPELIAGARIFVLPEFITKE